jgi:hypothetical protein
MSARCQSVQGILTVGHHPSKEAWAVRNLPQIIRACGRLLSDALLAAEPAVRAWHWGPTDSGGFAAMKSERDAGADLRHPQGLGIAWRPPESYSGSGTRWALSFPTPRQVIRSKRSFGPPGARTSTARLA